MRNELLYNEYIFAGVQRPERGERHHQVHEVAGGPRLCRAQGQGRTGQDQREERGRRRQLPHRQGQGRGVPEGD